MTKKNFIKYIKELERLKKVERKVSDAMQELGTDFNGFYLERHELLIVDILVDAMNDTDEWIPYWLYELDYGKKAKRSSVTKNGKNIPIKTINDLYNCIKNA